MNKSYSLAGTTLASPLVAAAGFQNGVDKSLILDKFNQLLDTAIGAITLGSFTLPTNDGNEIKYGPPVYYYDKKQGKTYNSMGLANIGLTQALKMAEQIIPMADGKGKAIILSGSPIGSEDYGTSVDQAVELAKAFLGTEADLVELNLSCPNIVTQEGGRKPIMGYDLESIEELLEALLSISGIERIGLKMPPYISQEEKSLIPKISQMLRSHKISFISVCNTIPSQIPRDEKGQPILSVPGGAGGMSGPATKKQGRAQLKMWHDNLGNKIDIVSLLGVDSGDELMTRLNMGAAAAGGVTFLRETQDWQKAVSEMLSTVEQSEGP